MKNFLAYLRSRMFLKNLALAVSLAVAMILILFIFLRIYTHHGKSIAVPDFSDLPITEAEEIIEERKLRYEIFDSVFIADREKGVVVDQHPLAGKLVKKNRKIYFTINANAPEKILMPDLEGITLREAQTKIEIAGLILGELSYRYDIGKNVVLEQLYNGERILKNDTIAKGSTIDLILGKGLANETSMVPDLLGLTVDEAKNKAANAFFTISVAIPDMSIEEGDTTLPLVFRQYPVHNPKVTVPLGSQITLWVTLDSTKLPGYGEFDSTDYVWDDLNEVDENDYNEEDNYDIDYTN
jgi:beta-lactam-binding protein with PASTA domain